MEENNECFAVQTGVPKTVYGFLPTGVYRPTHPLLAMNFLTIHRLAGADVLGF